MRFAAEVGADTEAAVVAGFLHDCGRLDDGGGNWHACESARLARPILETCFPGLDAGVILEAIAHHANGDVTSDSLVSAVWDADRLPARKTHVTKSTLSRTASERAARQRQAWVKMRTAGTPPGRAPR